MTERPEHSPLGASGAERWMNCPGSVDLLKHFDLPPSDDPSYRREGTAMHWVAEQCLRDQCEAWEFLGVEHDGVTVDQPMVLHVQEYVDFGRELIAQSTEHYVEYQISAPVHEKFYGKADLVAVLPDRLAVVDLKGGQGIVVEPEENPQLMYYAFGVIYGLEDRHGYCLPAEWPVDIYVAQPRVSWHPGGTIRKWTTTVDEIKVWTHDTLVPAMARAEIDGTLDAGPWCRFCPAKLVCPLLTSLFGAASKLNPEHVVHLDDQSLGRSYQSLQAVEFYVKAMKEETLRRWLAGRNIVGTKLVNKRANRAFKPGAADEAKAKFGTDAFTQPALKGPAAIEKLGPKGGVFVKEWAYTPETGYTVALVDDPRTAVRVEPASETFRGYAAALEAGKVEAI